MTSKDGDEPRGTQSFPDFRGRSILIAEDVESNLQLLRAILEPTGATLLFARNGREAVAEFESGKPDIILMDVHMPVMDGAAATERIRAMGEAGESVPIIALTAHAVTGRREQYLAAGMDGYLAKPVTVAEVLLITTRFLERP